MKNRCLTILFKFLGLTKPQETHEHTSKPWPHMERKPLGRTSHGLVWCTVITDLLKNFGKKHSFQWKISLDWWWGLLSQFLSLENGEIITPPLFIYIVKYYILSTWN